MTANLLLADNASPIALTIPPNSSVAYGIGTQINIMQLGAGQVTITAGAGVTLNSEWQQIKTKDSTRLQLAPRSLLILGWLSAICRRRSCKFLQALASHQFQLQQLIILLSLVVVAAALTMVVAAVQVVFVLTQVLLFRVERK
jgi:hypothetical protein